MQVREKGRKVTIHCVFPMIWGSGGSKSNLAKAAGAEPAGQMREKKMHAVVAPSTFPSRKCEELRGSDHFLTFRCRKSARCCGTKHISKSKVSRTEGFGPLSDVQMSPLWHEAHFQEGSDHFLTFRCRKSAGFGPLFDVQMSKKCTQLWHEAHFQVKSVKN